MNEYEKNTKSGKVLDFVWFSFPRSSTGRQNTGSKP